MYAPAKPNYPILTLEKFAEYDGWVFGIPTRYGTMPAQWKVTPCCDMISSTTRVNTFVKTFWDSTGKLWQTGQLFGKYAATFVSTSGPGGGQETTALTTLTTFTHHGINYVPLGYGYSNAAGEACFALMSNVDEVHGGTLKSLFLSVVCLIQILTSSRIALGRWNVHRFHRRSPAHRS